MALSFAGNGTIAGLSVGGLPDGTVDGDTLASGTGGKVLQFVHTVKTDSFASTSVATWTDITGLSVTTGSLASTGSKVLVQASINIISHGNYGHARIVDGSGNVITGFTADAAGSRTLGSFAQTYSGDGAVAYASMSANLYDSPSSISAQTYKIQYWNTNGTTHVNRSSTDGDNTSYGRTVSSISAMEISA